jgi:V/A-type H+/Na+-transporting ATPase subunit E
MGLEKVKEEILSKAKKVADSIIAKARKEEMKIIKEAEHKASIILKDNKEKAKKIIENTKIKELAKSELACKKALLETKKEIIDDIIDTVKTKVKNFRDDKKKKIIQELLTKASKELKIGYVYCKESDKKFIKKYKTMPLDLLGGVIVENKDKTIRINYSFDAFIENIKEKNIDEINKSLF